jgi:hypothetical protein
MDKQITGLLKQNESIYGSLKAKNVEGLGELVTLAENLSLEEQKYILLQENARLKELVKASKPVEEPIVQPKEKPKPQVQSKSKPKDLEEGEEEEDCLYNLNPPPPKFSTIANMEDLKRSFFSGEYEQFDQLVKANPYKFFTASYKFASDKDGAPDYSARNLVKGFVRLFDDYRKYFMICFRCMQTLESATNPTYTYPSIWIVNTLDPIGNLIGSTAEDFDMIEVTEPDSINELIQTIKKIDQETSGFVAEAYVH